MAKRDRLAEDVRYLTEMLKLTWLSLLAASGGTIGLALTELGLRRVALGAGIMVMIILLGALAGLHQKVRL